LWDRRQQNMVMSPAELWTKDDCADEQEQQQFTREKEREWGELHGSQCHEEVKYGHESAELGTKNCAGKGQQKITALLRAVEWVSQTGRYGHGSCRTRNHKWLCLWRPATIYLTQPTGQLESLTTQESWDKKLQSRVPQGPKPRISVLVKARRKLPDQTITMASSESSANQERSQWEQKQ
jgi:hypothetical protein